MESFYKGSRWTNWRDEVSELSGDKVYSFFPYLLSTEGMNINEISRKIVPVAEAYLFNLNMQKQLFPIK